MIHLFRDNFLCCIWSKSCWSKALPLQQRKALISDYCIKSFSNELWADCYSTPGCSLHSCGSPQHHHGAQGLSNFAYDGEIVGAAVSRASALDWLNLHIQQVVSDRAVSERSYVLLSLIFKASLSCVWSTDSLKGEKYGIHLAPRSRKSEGWRKHVGVGMGAREDSTIKEVQ